MAWLTKVQTRLGLHPRRMVHALLDGAFAARTSGRSLEFQDLRNYVRGDDVKDIDWKASARSGDLLTKRYVAQRRHTLLAVVPAGPQMAAAATMTASKMEVALLALGVFGFLASRNGDHMSLIFSSADGPSIARPSNRAVDLERMLGDVESACTLTGPEADFEELLELATVAVRRRCIAVVVLDDWQPTPASSAALQRLASRHETLAICVNDIDPTDDELRRQRVVDMQTGRKVAPFVCTDAALARAVAEDRERRRAERGEELRRLGILRVELQGPDDVVPGIIAMLGEMRHAATQR